MIINDFENRNENLNKSRLIFKTLI